ncbi:enoyl-CoA hydratase/carnithine racemase [Neobacillus niacini]|nr:enoyl-CoA hydratase/carnithine racemase [Neobacillus niacini]
MTGGVIDDLTDFITKIKMDEQTTVLIMRADGTKAISSGMNFKDVFPSELNTTAHAYSIQQKLCDVIAGINNTHQIVINLSFGHCNLQA